MRRFFATASLPTSPRSSPAISTDTRRATQRLQEARDSGASEAHAFCGVHLEGPFLSPQRAGTHPARDLRAPDLALLDQLLDLDDVAMMTIAPELPGALELIEHCVDVASSSRSVTAQPTPTKRRGI